MKFLFICLFALCLPLYSFSRKKDCHPFIEDDKVWHSCHSDMWGRYHRYSYFDGDTIVGEQRCKKWIQKIEWIKKVDGLPEDNGVWTDCCSLYEEDQKVWCFLQNTTTPLPMFDFGAEVGDTIMVTNINTYRWTLFQIMGYSIEEYIRYFQEKVLITRKEQTERNGWNLSEVGFIRISGVSYDYDYQASMNYVWEGIGDRRGPCFWTGVFDGDGTRNSLISCTVGDEVLYFDVDAAMYWNVPIPSSIQSPSLNANPSTQRLFDLSGRRLSVPSTSSVDSVLPKGVYIENGKKRVRN